MTDRQLSPIERFACAVIDQHRNDGYPGDVEGGWLQDKLEALGMLHKVPVTEPCADLEYGNCPCAEYGDIPGECLRLKPDVFKLLALYRKEETEPHAEDSSK